MEGLEALLEEIRKRGIAEGHFRGFLHLIIGRKLTRTDGTVVSAGMTWRAVADLLKRMRWSPDAVRELGLDPEALPPRDRQRFWFAAISAAHIESAEAAADADAIGALLNPLGYVVGPAPRIGG
jgi:hypothetical protein